MTLNVDTTQWTLDKNFTDLLVFSHQMADINRNFNRDNFQNSTIHRQVIIAFDRLHYFDRLISQIVTNATNNLAHSI